MFVLTFFVVWGNVTQAVCSMKACFWVITTVFSLCHMHFCFGFSFVSSLVVLYPSPADAWGQQDGLPRHAQARGQKRQHSKPCSCLRQTRQPPMPCLNQRLKRWLHKQCPCLRLMARLSKTSSCLRLTMQPPMPGFVLCSNFPGYWSCFNSHCFWF